MPILILDGPEKAGKTTIIHNLVDTGKVIIRPWGPVSSAYAYLAPLADDIELLDEDPTQWIVWDRSWAAETVYNVLVRRRPTPSSAIEALEALSNRPDIFKWMVLPRLGALYRRREKEKDETDHDVSPQDERNHFHRFATMHNWTIVEIGDNS